MSHRINAKLWVGEEEEYDDGETQKMFVDGATVKEIESALDEYPFVEELYFAHGVSPVVLRYFENKIKITVEVNSLGQVPKDLQGRVTVIFRVPTWVDKVKQKSFGTIAVTDLHNEDRDVTNWNGQKAYDEDQVVLWGESKDD